MYMLHKLLSFLLILILLLSSCTKSNTNCYTDVPNDPILFFQITKNGSPLTDSSFLSSIKISYYQNSYKQYVPYAGLWEIVADSSILETKHGIMAVNLKDGVNNTSHLFYIEYPNNYSLPDSFYASYSTPSTSNGCQYVIDSVQFDGNPPQSD